MTICHSFTASFITGFRKDTVDQTKFFISIILLFLWKLLALMKIYVLDSYISLNIFFLSRYWPQHTCPIRPFNSIKWSIKSFLNFSKETQCQNKSQTLALQPEDLKAQLSIVKLLKTSAQQYRLSIGKKLGHCLTV